MTGPGNDSLPLSSVFLDVAIRLAPPMFDGHQKRVTGGKSMAESEIDVISSYHAHIYYQPNTRKTAIAIRDALDARFKGAIRLGRWHEKKIGPHTRSMYQVAFYRTVFPEIVPWLALNRGGLTVLVHPESGDSLSDHTDHAIWMGEVLDIDRSIFLKD